MTSFDLNLSKILRDHSNNEEKTQDEYVKYLCLPFTNTDTNEAQSRRINGTIISALLLTNMTDQDSIAKHISSQITDNSVVEYLNVLLDMVEVLKETMVDFINADGYHDDIMIEIS